MNVPASEIHGRIERFQTRLRASSIDAAIIHQGVDLYYLAGVACDAHLVVPATGDPCLLVRRDLDRARSASSIPDIRSLDSLSGVAAAVGKAGRVGLEFDVLPVAHYLRLGKTLPDAELVDCSRALMAQRARKSPWEIGRIAAAGQMVAEAQRRAQELVTVGCSDREVQVELEAHLRRAGHQGPMRMRGINGQLFYGAVLGGADGAVASHGDTPLGGPGAGPAYGHGPRGHRLAAGEALTVDLVAVVDGYMADQTRTLAPVPLREPLADAYEVCVRTLRAVEEHLRPGVPWNSLYEIGLRLATEAGYEANYMGHGPSRVRFVGHGLGLEINEPPFLAAGFDAKLEEGMVVAVEPKLVFPGVGAVGIENTYAVRATGPVQLTPDS